MAEPARQLDDQEHEGLAPHQPGQVIRPVYDEPTGTAPSEPGEPNLKALEGGGKTTKPIAGQPQEVNDEDPSPQDLFKAEKEPVDNTQVNQKSGSFYTPSSSNSGKQGFAARLNNSRSLKNYLIFGGVGATIIAIIIALFSFLSIFKLDGLMSSIEQKAFLRNNAVFDRRSSKWVGAYIEARMLDLGNDPKFSDPNPRNSENILFRSDRYDSNNPFTDWYRTLRTSKFEQKVFEEHGIKFTSMVTADGKIRPGVININGKRSEIPIGNLKDSDIVKIQAGDIKALNKYQAYLETTELGTDKEARKAIKKVVNENTHPFQIYKRRHLRKAIQNMTGVRDWRFFDNTRTKIREKKIDVRNKILDKAIPEKIAAGKVARCLLGIDDCIPNRDAASPANRESVGPKGTPKEKPKDTTTDEDLKKNAELNKLAGINERLARILTTIGIYGTITNIVNNLDLLSSIHKNISHLGKTITVAKGVQAMGLYQVFTTSRDQIKSGEVKGAEVNEFMQVIDTAASSDGWVHVVNGEGDPAKTSSSGVCDNEVQAKAEKNPLSPEAKAVATGYAPLCADQRIGGANNGQLIQDDYNKSIGHILGPIANAWNGAKGNWFTNKIYGVIKFVSNTINSVVDNVVQAVLKVFGLDDNVKQFVVWLFGKVTTFLGAGPILSGKESESGGLYLNWLVQGGAYTAESTSRQQGAAITNPDSQAAAQLAISQYKAQQREHTNLYDRIASLENSDSLAYKGVFALSNLPSDPSGTLGSTLSNIWSSVSRSIAGIFSGKLLAATPNGYAASEFAGIETYDYPQQCHDLNPITAAPKDGTNIQSVLGAKVHDTDLTWDLVSDSNKFYDYVYEKIGEDTENADDIAVQIYNCNLLDTAVRGSLGYLYGYTKDNGLDDTAAPISISPQPSPDDAINFNDLYKDSVDVPCVSGTQDLGVQDGYHDGQLTKIRICALPNLSSSGSESNGGYGVPNAKGKAIVNSRVSSVFHNLVKAAKKDGVVMQATSSFRTMAHQTCLYNHTCGSNEAAQPGFSNHQMGLAIDFATASGSTISRGDQWFSWLNDEAVKFGIKNYPAESWHWSPTGN